MRVKVTLNLLIWSILLSLAFIAAEAGRELQPVDSAKPLYLDTAYSFEERAADLVSRMTLEEKQSQLGNFMPALPRLGVNAYNVWGEALHGVASFFAPIPATSFPNSVAAGASWDPDLIEREATAISDEARGLNSDVIKNLTYWSPVVEPVRDPRWGRTGESYGEDPFLVSEIAGAFVRGMRGTDPTYLKAVPTAKHFFANNSEFNRHNGSSNVDARDLREYYVAPYRALIEQAALPGIMTSYNRVNDIPVTGSKYFVDRVVRKTYGMNGYVTGDCGAVQDIFSSHRHVATSAEAAALALQAGVDTDCGNVFQKSAIEAVREGYMTEADMDRALLHVFTTRMRTGEFDPPGQVAYSRISRDAVASAEHARLAVEVAEKTIVLLKNELVPGTRQRALPLDEKALRKVAILGPKADQVDLGPYSGVILPEHRVTPLDGIRNLLGGNAAVEVIHRKGASASFRGNLFTVSSFTVFKTDGSARTYSAADFSEASGGVEFAPGMLGRRIRNLNDGGWTSYADVDVGNVEKIGVTLSVPGDGGTIEFRVGSRTGEVVASFDIEGTGSPFMTVTRTTSANRISVSGSQTVFLIYRAPPVVPVDQDAVSQAAAADAAVIFVGTDDRTAGEEADRKTLVLPGGQVDLIKAVAKVNPHTIVVMQTLGMVEVEEFKHLPNVPGIIWYGFNGQAQGMAIAKVLFGDVNPGGKLNATWYKSVRDLPDLTDYDLRGGNNKNGRTYWYFDKEVSYEFGYGLSYTTFEFSNVRIDKQAINPNDRVTVSVDVRNTGPFDGDVVVQLYVSTPDSPASLQRPIRRLKGFRRVGIQAGQTRTVSIDLNCSDLWFWDEVNNRITFDQGRYLFEIGDSSRDIRGSAEAVMTGAYQPGLKTVAAECGRVSLELGSTTATTVTAAMTDDSFLDLNTVPVRYTSNRPLVAAVDSAGLVTAKAPGVATITASVTVGGRVVMGSYAVKVKPDLTLDGISVGGRHLEEFEPERHGYSLLFDRSNHIEVPEVRATASNASAGIEIRQATGVPGTALIEVTDDATNESALYGVYFGFRAQGDDFDGPKLGKQWHWVREDSASWSLGGKPGSLVVTGQEGDIMNQANSAANILLQPANTDWFIESKLAFPEPPSLTDQQGGLLAYQDDDNYVKVVYDRAVRGFLGSGEFLELIVEKNGSQYVSTTVDAAGLLDRDRSLVFRLEKRGSQYRAYYSQDGRKFTLIGITDTVLSNVQAGLIVCNGSPETRRVDMLSMMLEGRSRVEGRAFELISDFFHIRSTGLRLP